MMIRRNFKSDRISKYEREGGGSIKNEEKWEYAGRAPVERGKQLFSSEIPEKRN